MYSRGRRLRFVKENSGRSRRQSCRGRIGCADLPVARGFREEGSGRRSGSCRRGVVDSVDGEVGAELRGGGGKGVKVAPGSVPALRDAEGG